MTPLPPVDIMCAVMIVWRIRVKIIRTVLYPHTCEQFLKLSVFFQFRFSFWVTICKVFHLMLSDRCPVCLCVLSVTLVYCGQMVGWIKMKLGVEVGLSPGHIVLDGDPAPPKGAQPPIFGPYLLRPNGWMDQDAT